MKFRDLRLFSSIPVLQTERLTLRRIIPSDLEDVYKYSCDEGVTKYLLWYPHKNKKQTAAYLKTVDKKYRKSEFFDWGITLTEEGNVLGTCGFTAFDIMNNSAEIGYVLNREYWGRGIASEAARAVITFGFEVLDLNRIEARIMPENDASRALLERCGMQYEGKLRACIYAKEKYIDILVYSITAEDYRKYCNSVI